MVWHDIAQNTEPWLQLRAGKVGGSSIGSIMANYDKDFGQPAHDLALKIAIERITGEPQLSTYTNSHMERGHEQEPIARALYEEYFFCDVLNGGFFEDGNCGVSPDGLVGDDGLIEIKSVIAKVHFATISRNTFDPSYKWQLYYNLMITKREWIDFVSFCSEFPEGKRLYTCRIMAEDVLDKFAIIKNRLDQFWVLVDEKQKTIMEM